MLRILFILVFVFHSTSAYSCPADPLVTNALNPDSALEHADIAFYGRLAEFDNRAQAVQLASFEVLQTFKGPELKRVTINNYLNSLCSRTFENKGSKYYVFAQLDKEKKRYVIKDVASFVPEKIAIERNMKLDPAKKEKSRKESP